MKTKTALLLVVSLSGSALTNWGADPPMPAFRAVDVDAKIEIGYGVAVADVDGDGKLDILLADKKQFVWYKNPTWEKFVLAENLTKEDNVCIAAADIDGDGKCEIAVGAGWNPNDTTNSGAVFYLIAPKDRTNKWEAVELPHEPTVHRMHWVRRADGKSDLVVVPLHGRENKNGEGEGVRILAYKMPADPRQPWKTELINDSMHMTHNFSPLSIGLNDGVKVKWMSAQMLVAGKEGVVCLREVTNEWKQLCLLPTHPKGAGEVRRLHPDSGLIATIEPMHGNEVVVYASSNRPLPPLPDTSSDFVWRRTVIDSSLKEGHALACGDLLGLGRRAQIIAGWRAKNADGKVGIKLFTPLDAEGKNWRQTLIDDNTMACEDLTLADLNGDGKLDIVAAGRATKNVKVYFNEVTTKAQ